MKAGTKATLAGLRDKNARAAGWIVPGEATPRETIAVKVIQAHARGYIIRRRGRKGLKGKVDKAIARAEIQLVKRPLVGCLCNITTRWGCEWSNRNRKPLLVIAAILVLCAFVVQKFSFMGLWLDPGIMTAFSWSQYEVAPQIALTLIYMQRNASDPAEMTTLAETAQVLLQDGIYIPTKANIWGQCAWLSGSAKWGVDDGSSRCWTWSELELLTSTADANATAFANASQSVIHAVGEAFKDCDDAGDQLIPAVCIGLLFSIFPIGDSFSRWTLEKDSGHAKTIGMLISAIVMTIDALNFFRYHRACVVRLEDSSSYFQNAGHGFGFVCLYSAWLLTGTAFLIKAFIPGMDLRDTDKGALYRAELNKQFQEMNPFKAAMQKHQQNKQLVIGGVHTPENERQMQDI